ncbi:MAG: cytochrome c biogenesis protein CcsA [Ilumatobacteraceae bacterium]|nr:cytochrome c biogenesis protein CcsA [Ilumatobacteraceae bacterium]MBJ7425321.1 cytochrome c biogenesis protein CcsA [Ilumatobacteraceae bacterium]MBJ7507965.1 cytochrome c biogenesis protein CcsA [Ilumatobacteraceae bacterium]
MSNDRATSTPFTKGLGFFVVLGIALLIILGIFVSPADVNQGESVRIMYAHVPGAWLAYLAFVMTAVSSAAYLWKRTRSLTWDRIAGASAEVGVLFMGISLVTGSLWGRLTWGTYWTWDARLTTTAFLFVTYIGYLAVRGLGGTHQQRARRSAVLALLAVLEIPLVHFSVELWNTLHQEASVAGRGTDVEMNGLMLFTLFLGVVVFTLMYIWLVLHRQRSLMLEDMLDDSGLDHALSERRAEATQAGH